MRDKLVHFVPFLIVVRTVFPTFKEPIYGGDIFCSSIFRDIQRSLSPVQIPWWHPCISERVVGLKRIQVSVKRGIGLKAKQWWWCVLKAWALLVQNFYRKSFLSRETNISHFPRQGHAINVGAGTFWRAGGCHLGFRAVALSLSIIIRVWWLVFQFFFGNDFQLKFWKITDC